LEPNNEVKYKAENKTSRKAIPYSFWRPVRKKTQISLKINTNYPKYIKNCAGAYKNIAIKYT